MSRKKLRPDQLAQEAATSGQVLAWDGFKWAPTTPDEQTRDAIAAALVAGANITITIDDPANTITIASSPGQLLMQDGVSSPPVPLETEDGTDWLYEG